MTGISRLGLVAGAIALLAFAGLRIGQAMQADAALDRDDSAAALQARPDNPQALLLQAEARLAANDLGQAEALARRQLQAAPADGRGYRVLAQVAAARGQGERALALYRIAAARAPRDLPARAWLAQHALEQGRHAEALEQIDAVLSLSPSAGRRIYPVLVQLAADPAFADALATRLAGRPAWRGTMLSVLRAPSGGDPAAADRILSALQRQGGLAPGEFEAWIDALMQQGRWGEAHARWSEPQLAAGRPLALLFNGDFQSPPQGTGFDWRISPVAGVLPQVEPAPKGGSLHLRFLGRRVASAPVEHALLLAPGTYRMTWRERSESLRANSGIGWIVTCADTQAVLGRGVALRGTQAWRERELAFTVPVEGCQGQWLRLGNAEAGAQILAGDAWFADARIVRQAGSPAS